MNCLCNVGGRNTGRPSCIEELDYAFGILMVKLVADDGGVNRIDCNTQIPLDISALVNATDKSKRLYPVSELVAVVSERADSTTETIDNKNYNVEKGVRTFLGQLIGGGSSPTFLKVLESFACGKWGYYIIGQDGALVGEEKEEGFLYPFAIQERTFDSKHINATASSIAKNQLSFTVSSKVKDSRTQKIPAEFIDGDLLEVEGLIDVVLTETTTNTTTTALEVKANYIYGNLCRKSPFTAGGDVASWSLLNETTSLPVTIDAVTIVDAELGIFSIEYSSGVSVADVLKLSTNLSGFESNVLTKTVV